MKKVIQPVTGIEVRDTGRKRGRGVFATRDFKTGELVERCPVIEVPNSTHVDASIATRLFRWPVEKKTFNSALALGFGSLYNHDDNPSLRYASERKEGCLLFYARRDIQAGEELTISYNDFAGEKPGRWFEVQGIEKLDP